MKIEKNSGISFLTIFPVIAFALFVLLLWYSYKNFVGEQKKNPSSVTIIKADKTPFKEKPVDPGGMKIQYKDKEVFSAIQNNDTEQAPVNIISPEKPLSKDKIAEIAKNPTVNESENDENSTESAEAKPIEASQKQQQDWTENLPPQEERKIIERKKNEAEIKQEEEAKKQSSTEEKNDSEKAVKTSDVKKEPALKDKEKLSPKKEDTKEVVKADEKKLELPKSQAKKSDETKTNSQKFFIQLGAFSSAEGMNSAWDKFRKKAPEIATKSSKVTSQKNGKYILQIGSYSSKDLAAITCKNIKSKGVDCLVK
jgi:cell division septation protein DedD